MREGLALCMIAAALLGLTVPLSAQEWARQRLEKSPRHGEWVVVKHGSRAVHAFLVYPERKAKAPAVVVIHENRGLTDWVRGVADQLAEAGYVAIAPDLLSGHGPGGGRTKDFPNEDAAREALYQLPADQVVADLQAVADYVAKLPAVSGKVAVAGFCWGGTQSFLFATRRPSLAAAYVFYGTAPEDPKAIARIRAPVYGFYAGEDARVNATLPQTTRLMKGARKTFLPVTYPGAGHGFMRAGEEPGGSEANQRARREAWRRWKGLLKRMETGKAPSAKLAANGEAATPQALAYPPTRRGDEVDDYHGTRVADPYRWLEAPDSPETREWIEAQNKLTFAYLEGIPGRDRIKQRLTRLWDYERFGLPYREGTRYFFGHNEGLQNQSVLFVAESLNAQPRVLLDPNTLSEDGTVALAGTAVSEDGKYLAYGLQTAGSDWSEWKVRSVDTGEDRSDHLKWVKFSGASWTHDGKGFFYSRYDEPKPGQELQEQNYYQKLYYHRLGTPQAEDTLVYERKDQKEWGFGGAVTEDGRYLVIHVWQGTDPKNRVFYKDLKDPQAPAIAPGDSPVVELLPDADASYDLLGNDGPLFWFLTDRDAPRKRVIAVDLRKPAPADWKELIPQAAETLEGVGVVGDRFLATYLKDAHTQVKVFDLQGRFQREVALPGLGSAWGFGGKRREKETFYTYTSFTVPATLYRYDVQTGESTLFRQPTVDFNPNDYETKQVFYQSKDGTRVPMFITHRKGLKLDGRNPTYLYGYGGFRASLTPGFSVANLVWMEMGGVYAVPNLRGGGEYGEEWHLAGTKLKKQNVFDDFIAAAEWLVQNRYTSPDKLAIGGGSNGGLLVGAAMTQRPDLFAAALPAVGVMDMLRFHKFTIGWAWMSDYGSPDNPEEFRALYAYSPLHNLKPGTRYPATLVTTSDHDDRVVPAHSFKFAAALQAAQAGDKPTLIRIETRAGHGGGKPMTKIIQEIADEWAFLTHALGMEVPRPGAASTAQAPTSPESR